MYVYIYLYKIELSNWMFIMANEWQVLCRCQREGVEKKTKHISLSTSWLRISWLTATKKKEKKPEDPAVLREWEQLEQFAQLALIGY